MSQNQQQQSSPQRRSRLRSWISRTLVPHESTSNSPDNKQPTIGRLIQKYNEQLGFGKQYHTRLTAQSQIARILRENHAVGLKGFLLQHPRKRSRYSPLAPADTLPPIGKSPSPEKAKDAASSNRSAILLVENDPPPPLLLLAKLDAPSRTVSDASPDAKCGGHRVAINQEIRERLNSMVTVSAALFGKSGEDKKAAATRTRGNSTNVPAAIEQDHGQRKFYAKYLRQILTTYDDDPYLNERYRRYAEKIGEVQLGKRFLRRMREDILGRQEKSGAASKSPGARSTNTSVHQY